MSRISDWSEVIEQADALIFDMDGTLIDSMPAHYQAWRQVADEYGLTLDRDRFYQLGGVPTYQTLQILSAEAGVSIDLDAAKTRKEGLYREYVSEVTEIAPIADVARQYANTKPLAIATGAGRNNAQSILTRLGLIEMFQAVMTADDVENHKPAPDVFLKAAAALGIAPERCVAFEDTDIGLEAIRAAGMTAIDVRPLLD
ncbi:HAD family hydrolase [Reinekea blandensis]|uniref:Putative phosphatase n=1 Tax=Reinekea blandensis MED297 TaxID=314283 RepID=A4BES1_9GAMM|nr:beta-phosphoglucomutase family hydrolase [Reinekea blandensis]EAR09498.1 putative phosphatase [Reinekea sp. MED297] [Reinekea blandensis MED297]